MKNSNLKVVSIAPGGSDLLGEAVKLLEESNPRKFILMFVDPEDDKVVVCADGSSFREQLGMLEVVKDMFLHREA